MLTPIQVPVHVKPSPNSLTVMTLTDELYLPTRLVYEVYDAKRLRTWLQKTSCVQWNPLKQGWTWNYDGVARSLGFPPAYAKVPKERQPVVLATGYLVDEHTFHVYTRCGLRTVKFLVFFDKQVSRSIAIGRFIDQYNLITAVRRGAPVPLPEDYFKDESKIEFFDLIGLLDLPNSPAKEQALTDYHARIAQRTLCPLERHRLDGFYHDGATMMESVMQFRELMAVLQSQSDEPIRPMEVMSRMLSQGGQGLSG
jgi:hypothetical protein